MEYHSVITDFNREVQEITALSHTLPAIRQGVLLCRKTLYRLRQMVREDGLGAENAEIRFFKEIKSGPLSWLIYFTEVGSCELRKPRADRELQKQFYKKQLHKADKFFQKHRDFIYYMEQGHTYLDTEYFTRKAWGRFPFSPGEGYRDPDFSTSHDLLWARVKAMTRFVDYPKGFLYQGSQDTVPDPQDTGTGKLVWTLPKTAAVELLYALYHSGAFNHGNVELKEVVRVFEKNLNTDLGNFYNTFSEIRARKIERTKYMDLFAEKLLQKMEEGDL